MNGRSSIDDIIDLYKKDVDVTLLEENLKLTHTQRMLKLQDLVNTFEKLQQAKKVKKDDEL